MTKINDMQNINKPNFQPIGRTDDGKVIVNVKDITTGNYTRNLVPIENIDKYEKAVNDFQNKYEPLTRNHYAKGNKILHLTSIASATLGGAITAACLKPNTKATGKFFKVAGGAIAGWVTAATVLGTILLKDFFKYYKTVKDLNIINEPMLKNQQQNTNLAPEKEVEKIEEVEKKEVKESKEEVEKEPSTKLPVQNQESDIEQKAKVDTKVTTEA